MHKVLINKCLGGKGRFFDKCFIFNNLYKVQKNKKKKSPILQVLSYAACQASPTGFFFSVIVSNKDT